MKKLISCVMTLLIIFSTLPTFAPQVEAQLEDLTPHDPISIRSDSDFTPENGVTGGSGTPEDPYIIEGWEIADQPDYTLGIDIRNTSSYFIIRNVWIHEIYPTGINILDSFWEFFSHGRIENCRIEECQTGILAQEISDLTIVRNDITVYGYGIEIIDIHTGPGVNITANDIVSYDGWGIGIYAYAGGQTLATLYAVGNTVRSYDINWGGGMYIAMNAPSVCKIMDNDISGNYDTRNAGIELDVHGATVSGNNIASFYFGLEAWNGIGSYVTRNSISDSKYGLYFYYRWEQSQVTENDIFENDFGVYISDSSENVLYHNNIVDNAVQAIDLSLNVWDNGYEGNYWSDYDGADDNGDGIGDTPYMIDADSIDNYPLITPWQPWYSSEYVKSDYKIASFNVVENWVWENCVPLLLLNSECGLFMTPNPMGIPYPCSDADTVLQELNHRPTWYYRVIVDEVRKEFVVQLFAYWEHQHQWIGQPSKCARVGHPHDYEPIFLYCSYSGDDFFDSLQTGKWSHRYAFHTVGHGKVDLPDWLVPGIEGSDAGQPDSGKMYFWEDQSGNKHPVLAIGFTGESWYWNIVQGILIQPGIPIFGMTSYVGHAYAHVLEGPVTYGWELKEVITGQEFVENPRGYEAYWPSNREYASEFEDSFFKPLLDDTVDEWSSYAENAFKMLPEYGSQDLIDPWNDNYKGLYPSVGEAFDPSAITYIEDPNWHEETVEEGINEIDAKEEADTIVTIEAQQPGTVIISKYPENPTSVPPESGFQALGRHIEISTDIPSAKISWPIEIKVYYEDEDVAASGIEEESLRLYYWDGTEWVEEAESDVNTEENYVWANVYHLSPFAPIGTILPPVITATIDIDPDSLNLKSEGKWITAYIELPEDHDVSVVDVATIILNDTIPTKLHPTEVGDYDGDGIPDLMVKFDRQEVIALLSVGEAVLTITGEANEVPFEGSDTIRAIQ